MSGPSSVNRPLVTLRAMTAADSGTAMTVWENRRGLSLRRILSRTLLALGLRRAPPATPVSLTENTSSSSGTWYTEKAKHIPLKTLNMYVAKKMRKNAVHFIFTVKRISKLQTFASAVKKFIETDF